jgi:hypothetical protein
LGNKQEVPGADCRSSATEKQTNIYLIMADGRPSSSLSHPHLPSQKAMLRLKIY